MLMTLFLCKCKIPIWIISWQKRNVAADVDNADLLFQSDSSSESDEDINFFACIIAIADNNVTIKTQELIIYARLCWYPSSQWKQSWDGYKRGAPSYMTECIVLWNQMFLYILQMKLCRDIPWWSRTWLSSWHNPIVKKVNIYKTIVKQISKFKSSTSTSYWE